ncbi:hypothetical protein HY988_00750 [Candidatus Micrarchaeota archaeon]|nr:hypothetical protein [Candidatus Micrarchaeota archaeon]
MPHFYNPQENDPTRQVSALAPVLGAVAARAQETAIKDIQDVKLNSAPDALRASARGYARSDDVRVSELGKRANAFFVRAQKEGLTDVSYANGQVCLALAELLTRMNDLGKAKIDPADHSVNLFEQFKSQTDYLLLQFKQNKVDDSLRGAAGALIGQMNSRVNEVEQSKALGDFRSTVPKLLASSDPFIKSAALQIKKLYDSAPEEKNPQSAHQIFAQADAALDRLMSYEDALNIKGIKKSDGLDDLKEAVSLHLKGDIQNAEAAFAHGMKKFEDAKYCISLTQPQPGKKDKDGKIPTTKSVLEQRREAYMQLSASYGEIPELQKSLDEVKLAIEKRDVAKVNKLLPEFDKKTNEFITKKQLEYVNAQEKQLGELASTDELKKFVHSQFGDSFRYEIPKFIARLESVEAESAKLKGEIEKAKKSGKLSDLSAASAKIAEFYKSRNEAVAFVSTGIFLMNETRNASGYYEAVRQGDWKETKEFRGMESLDTMRKSYDAALSSYLSGGMSETVRRSFTDAVRAKAAAMNMLRIDTRSMGEQYNASAAALLDRSGKIDPVRNNFGFFMDASLHLLDQHLEGKGFDKNNQKLAEVMARFEASVCTSSSRVFAVGEGKLQDAIVAQSKKLIGYYSGVKQNYRAQALADQAGEELQIRFDELKHKMHVADKLNEWAERLVAFIPVIGQFFGVASAFRGAAREQYFTGDVSWKTQLMLITSVVGLRFNPLLKGSANAFNLGHAGVAFRVAETGINLGFSVEGVGSAYSQIRQGDWASGGADLLYNALPLWHSRKSAFNLAKSSYRRTSSFVIEGFSSKVRTAAFGSTFEIPTLKLPQSKIPNSMASRMPQGVNAGDVVSGEITVNSRKSAPKVTTGPNVQVAMPERVVGRMAVAAETAGEAARIAKDKTKSAASKGFDKVKFGARVFGAAFVEAVDRTPVYANAGIDVGAVGRFGINFSRAISRRLAVERTNRSAAPVRPMAHQAEVPSSQQLLAQADHITAQATDALTEMRRLNRQGDSAGAQVLEDRAAQLTADAKQLRQSADVLVAQEKTSSQPVSLFDGFKTPNFEFTRNETRFRSRFSDSSVSPEGTVYTLGKGAEAIPVREQQVKLASALDVHARAINEKFETVRRAAEFELAHPSDQSAKPLPQEQVAAEAHKFAEKSAFSELKDRLINSGMGVGEAERTARAAGNLARSYREHVSGTERLPRQNQEFNLALNEAGLAIYEGHIPQLQNDSVTLEATAKLQTQRLIDNPKIEVGELSERAGSLRDEAKFWRNPPKESGQKTNPLLAVALEKAANGLDSEIKKRTSLTTAPKVVELNKATGHSPAQERAVPVQELPRALETPAEPRAQQHELTGAERSEAQKLGASLRSPAVTERTKSAESFLAAPPAQQEQSIRTLTLAGEHSAATYLENLKGVPASEKALGLSSGELKNVYLNAKSNEAAVADVSSYLEKKGLYSHSFDPRSGNYHQQVSTIGSLLLSGNLSETVLAKVPEGSKITRIIGHDGMVGAYEIKVVAPSGEERAFIAKAEDLRPAAFGAKTGQIANVPTAGVVSESNSKPLTFSSPEGGAVKWGLIDHIKYFSGTLNLGGEPIQTSTMEAASLSRMKGNTELTKFYKEHPEVVHQEIGYACTGLMMGGSWDNHSGNLQGMLLKVPPSKVALLKSEGYTVVDVRGESAIFKIGRIDTDAAGHFRVTKNTRGGYELYSSKEHLIPQYSKDLAPVFISLARLSGRPVSEVAQSATHSIKEGAKKWHTEVGSTPDFERNLVTAFAKNDGQMVGAGQSLSPTAIKEIEAYYAGGQKGDPPQVMVGMPINGQRDYVMADRHGRVVFDAPEATDIFSHLLTIGGKDGFQNIWADILPDAQAMAEKALRASR